MGHKRIVLITGANSGFGLLSSLSLAKRGCQVIAAMRDVKKSNELLDRAKHEGTSHLIDVIQLDVTREDHIKEAFLYVESQYGHLNVLVNNAGYSAGGMIEKLEIEEWRKQLDTNLFGVITMTKMFLPLLKKGKGAKIINLGSISGRVGFPGLAPYVTSKFAIGGFSESLRLELLPKNIYVCLIEAGSFQTNIWNKGLESVRSKKNGMGDPFFDSIYQQAKQTAAGAQDPAEVIQLIVKISEAKKPKFRYHAGKGVRLLVLFKSILPWSLVEWLINKRLMKKK
ncbi:SDR family oxidoreductase [Alkalihalophilus marmarensis]|uniref:SDR family oxidoreductase n=1 Tax=Alkalihalophilus marmarensis TaxID=521377 RepID=UPI002DB77314|nr:SDR family oxidoreductase [Alkalihalophilus marmarensis]MEC2071817.1 SDR family oxidoreductase [Alkalihalophilus marmarensis]